MRNHDATHGSVNMKKLEEAVHYICATATAADRLGAVKLNKILFYSDMLNYASTGHAITNATYVKRQRGPAPKEILDAIANLKAARRLETHEVSAFDQTRREFDAFGDTEIGIFGSDEIDRLNAMLRYVCSYTASEISDISHTVVWDAADMGEELPYQTFLVSQLGEADTDTEQRALEIVKSANQAGAQYV
jgi:hypothetical protein